MRDGRDAEVHPAPEQTIRERAKAAVLGSFVADAASMGLHWIYKVSHLHHLLEQHLAVTTELPQAEFFEPPSCPFYKYPSGNLSPYGFEARTVLESVAGVGAVDGPRMSQHMCESFKRYATNGGYLNFPSKELIANCDSGSNYPDAAAFDDQANCMVKVAVVVARYAGMPDMVEKIKEAVKTHQNHEYTEAAAVGVAIVLEKVVVDNLKCKEAIEWAMNSCKSIPDIAKTWMKGATSNDGMPIPMAIANMGQSCHIPDSFQGPLYTAYSAPGYVEAVRANIVAGGDSCSRALVIGALFGAQDGLDAIPDSWKAKTADYKVLEELVEKVLQSRPGGGWD